METEEKRNDDSKYFHAENITKNVYTTVIGCVLMGVSAFTFMIQWFVVLPVKPPEWWVLTLVFVVGFMLLFARDRIVTYVDIFTRNKLKEK